MILLCIIITACAYAESTPIFAEIEVGTDVKFDLTNDGKEQTIRAQYVGPADESVLQLVVFGDDGGVNLFNTEISSLERACITDLDENGEYEILMSGSVFAMDWMTYSVRFTEERGIEAMPFTDIDRGSDRTGYTLQGYGAMTINDDSTITLSGYQDVLGTYVGSRTFSLNKGKMRTCDDGLWRFEIDPNNWEISALMLMNSLKVTMEDGSRTELPAGVPIAVEASDLKSVVHFQLQDGSKGHFAIEPDTKRGYGSLIDGKSEDEYFIYIPYAG